MTDAQQKKLMARILDLHSRWAHDLAAEDTAMALNRLFETARDIDNKGMTDAFVAGLQRVRDDGRTKSA